MRAISLEVKKKDLVDLIKMMANIIQAILKIIFFMEKEYNIIVIILYYMKVILRLGSMKGMEDITINMEIIIQVNLKKDLSMEKVLIIIITIK